MTNVIDWLKACADFVARDCPDVYSGPQEALEELSSVMEGMRENNTGVALFSSYVMLWFPDEDGEEWVLTRKLATVLTDFETHDAMAYAWTKGSGTLKYGIESLPDILDEGLDM